MKEFIRILFMTQLVILSLLFNVKNSKWCYRNVISLYFFVRKKYNFQLRFLIQPRMKLNLFFIVIMIFSLSYTASGQYLLCPVTGSDPQNSCPVGESCTLQGGSLGECAVISELGGGCYCIPVQDTTIDCTYTDMEFNNDIVDFSYDDLTQTMTLSGNFSINNNGDINGTSTIELSNGTNLQIMFDAVGNMIVIPIPV